MMNDIVIALSLIGMCNCVGFWIIGFWLHKLNTSIANSALLHSVHAKKKQITLDNIEQSIRGMHRS